MSDATPTTEVTVIIVPVTTMSDIDSCHFAFNFEIRRVGCRKARFFALKGEMPIRFVRCSLILRVKAVLHLARATIDGGEQTGFLVIGPEQGDLGELCQVPFHLHRSQPHTPVSAVSPLGGKISIL
ncbi:hypothetical protein [Microvirga calopogonii]|uniref:hypothetical protein n=1 Tax=Microvirga calopogonii TaxID=2078013 RepID=UPI000E0CE713|nr:hypothetical protein [Microvirga calopogonii]